MVINMSYFKKLFNRKRLSRDLDKLEEEAFLEEEYEEESEDSKSANQANESEDLEDNEPEEYEIVEREILPAKIICPDCGGITLEGLEFCDKCGGELQ